MKKLSAILLVFILIMSLSACKTDNKDADTTTHIATVEDVQLFFDKVCENKRHIDIIASNICSAWKVAEGLPNATVKTVKTDVKKATNTYGDMLSEIDALDKEISYLYNKSKYPSLLNEVEQVMTAYENYTSLVLNPKIDGNTGGYNQISQAKNSLDKASRNLRSALN
ncbi:MAG: hypothetical protein IJM97_06115 [Clostridia bacterium]|nr:hypothetical protein [Clostridia bacterium]